MKADVKPSPAEIRRARDQYPKMRERDLANQLGISEAEYVAAWCGDGVARVEARVADLLGGLEAVGELMALTRNESAVHEQIGVYDNVFTGGRNAMGLGADIDLRIFPDNWVHGFAVEKRDGEGTRHSLQFFDKSGDAVHKVHLRPKSNLHAYQKLVDSLISTDQRQTVSVEAVVAEDAETAEVPADANRGDLLSRWSAMTDVHQFFGILRSLNLTRRQAVHIIGDDYAWPLDGDALAAMMHHSVDGEIPIMCFVGNRGCIQIHSGAIANVKPMGPWINVMDPTFHLHLRLDHVRELWAVRKPNKDGHVTSLEAYDAEGRMIIQFFGKRREGSDERDDWRFLVENLPRIPRSTAA